MKEPVYTLTPHALERLEQRTSISPENIHDLMSRAIEMPYALDADRGAKMFWSVPDDRAYLAFYNRLTRDVVTIYEAYKWIDGTFRGKVYTHRDMLGRLYGNGVSKVRRRDVAYCLRMAGLPPRKEFESIKAKKQPPGTGAMFSHEYMARFYTLEGIFIRRLKKIPFGTAPENIDMQVLLQSLHDALGRLGMDIDKVINVIIELREIRRGQEPIAPPIDEIELDQRTIKDTLSQSISQSIGIENIGMEMVAA